MTDPTAYGSPDGDKLRAMENDRAADRQAWRGDGFDGLRELSQAWHQNRSTEYLLHKAWADPINRWFFILVVLGIVAIWTFLLVQ